MSTKQIFTTILILLSFNSFATTTYYVSTGGSDSYNGTSTGTPFQTIDKAIGLAIAGDIIYVRAGTYILTSSISIGTSGTEGNLITLMGYPGESQPLLDFSTQIFGSRGIILSGSYWHIKGIRVKGAGDNGLHVSGANNIVEFCSFFKNRDSGLQLSNGASNNKISNCDSYFNADPPNYGDADGFAVKMDVGTGNYFYGCRSWMNCDDGWDGYLRGADEVTTTLENCWTSRNGYFKDGTDAGAEANGNGFKMGGSDDKTLKHNFILKNCLAFCNKAKNYDQNNNKGSMTLYNCTAFGGAKNYSIGSALAEGKTATISNSVSLNTVSSNSIGSFVIQQTNSWSSGFTTTAADFLSTDTALAYLPRKADGSLPDMTFMALAAGSDLIDAGTDLGIAYTGSKPDLGFREYDPALKIIELQSTKTLTIYPTLANDRIYISSGNKAISVEDIDIYSITGQKQNTSNRVNLGNNNSVEMDISHLAPGLYICHILLEGKPVQCKFVKQ